MDELSEEEAPAYALGLNALQRRAVLAPLNRPLEVIAPPGSGKTAVLTRRIEHVLVNNVPPQNVLAVTFTKAAADEMRCRLEKAVGKSVAKRVNISTFHALSLALCRSYSELAGKKCDFVVRTTIQQLKVVRQAIGEWKVAEAAAAGTKTTGGSGGGPSAGTSAGASTATTDPSRLLSQLMRLKAQGKTPDTISEGPGVSAALCFVYARYAKIMEEANAFDMLDFLIVATQALEGENEEHAAARRILHARYTHVLVDEFQDTNALQLKLLRLLCPDDADGGNITVVGDDDQAIFGFQGASGSFQPFEAAFPAFARIVLSLNYRSSETIVTSCSALVSCNTKRVHKEVVAARGKLCAAGIAGVRAGEGGSAASHAGLETPAGGAGCAAAFTKSGSSTTCALASSDHGGRELTEAQRQRIAANLAAAQARRKASVAAVEGSGRAAIGVNRGGDNAQSDGSATGPAAASATPVLASGQVVSGAHEPGAKLTVAACRTSADEASFIVSSIRTYVSSGGRPRDIAVLFRTSRVGVSLQNAFAGARLPFNTHATNLWETKAVRELTCLLRLLVDASDDDAFEVAVAAIAPNHAADLLETLHQRRRRTDGDYSTGRGQRIAIAGRGNAGRGAYRGQGESTRGERGRAGGGSAGIGSVCTRSSLREMAEKLRTEAIAFETHRRQAATAKPHGTTSTASALEPRAKRPKTTADSAENVRPAAPQQPGQQPAALPPPPSQPSIDAPQLTALNRVLETMVTLTKRVGELQLEGLVSRCAESLQVRAALNAPPKSRSGSGLLNATRESRSMLAIVLEHVREFERVRRSAMHGSEQRVSNFNANSATNGAVAMGLPHAAERVAMAERAAANSPLEERSRLRLRGLLEHFEMLRSEQEERISIDNADAITLCSMHASKGLEWPLVLCARMNEGECPLAVVGDAALEEERRLAYVALSRAKDQLYLSHIAVEPKSGEPAMPSRFLSELPSASLTHVQVYR